MTAEAVVIGIGNPFRNDDGIGPAVAAEVGEQRLPGVRVVISDGEPAGLLEAWSGADLAVVVDAIHQVPGSPGSIHRLTADQLETGGTTASSHGLGVPDALRLGQALGRLPRHVVIFAVEAADTGAGTELSKPVAAALPEVVAAVMTELKPAKTTGHTP
ncbi:MAG TPA: hydrogenase maturation protease [Streptosporangiaceae bacterium]|nr:hydrogenase maturation protease [Streptosporangiaceae bacterium]